MKKVQASALRKAQGAFLIVHEHEYAALQGLPLWAHALFMLLLRCADFEKGHGETSYTWLSERLAPVQPDRGPKHYAPDAQAVKRMVLKLEERRIVARDKRHSDATKTLFFSVAPRYHAEARPKKNSTPYLDPHQIAAKPATARVSGRSGSNLDPSSRPPLTRPNSLHKGERNLSTAAQPFSSRLVEQGIAQITVPRDAPIAQQLDEQHARDEAIAKLKALREARRGTPSNGPPEGGST